eukprot:227136-Prorocentrum_minimum.AAC.1
MKARGKLGASAIRAAGGGVAGTIGGIKGGVQGAEYRDTRVVSAGADEVEGIPHLAELIYHKGT